MNDTNDSDQGSSLQRFFGRPAVGITGSIASILGIGFSMYFFLASQEKPDLTYFVHPAKAAVVRTDQTSRLAVQFDGRELTSNITAAQIAFWNAGKKPIRANSILSPLVIRTGDKNRILEARLRKTSRDVVKITLDTSRLADGEVEIGWNILEQNDGGVLQIVFAGDETVDIQAHAVLEGQSKIVELEYALELRTLGEEYARRRGIRGQLPMYAIIALGVLIIPITLWVNFRKRGSVEKLKAMDWVFLAQAPIMIGVGVWALLLVRTPGPPFGF